MFTVYRHMYTHVTSEDSFKFTVCRCVYTHVGSEGSFVYCIVGICTHMLDQRTALCLLYVYTREGQRTALFTVCRHVYTHVRVRGQLLGASFLLHWFLGIKLRSLGSQQTPLPTEPAYKY